MIKENMNLKTALLRVLLNPNRYSCKNWEAKSLWNRKGTIVKVYENDVIGILFDGDDVPRQVWRDSVDIIED
jgi:hypothetical protein